MSDLLGVTLDQMVSGLKARRVRIPAEIGAYVALEVAEQLERSPGRITNADVRIGDDGVVSLSAVPSGGDEDAAVRSVVAVLASTLVAAGTGVPGVLIRIVEDSPPTGAGALAMLTSELESSLVPLNRAAARRVLSRMTRDARRPLSERPPDGPATLDDALDDLLKTNTGAHLALDAPDVAPKDVIRAALTAPKSVRPPPPTSEDVETVADSSEQRLDDATLHGDGGADEAPTSKVEKQLPLPATPSPEPAKAAPRAKEKPRPLDVDEFERGEAPTGRSGALGFVIAFLTVVLGFVAVMAWLRPDLVDAALGRPPPPSGPTQADRDAEQARLIAEHRAHFGTLSVTSEPAGAQVLLFVGRGPAVAHELPTGAAYELVAFADGHGASRAIVPADAHWDESDEGPRYELALQTSDVEIDLSRLDLGASRLPRDAMGTPSATLGSVRVVTSPPGARVYMLIGFTPDVRYENIRTDEPAELLVYEEGYEVERVLVGPSDWRDGSEGTKLADLSVTLHELTPVRRR
jgi:hypothetical protein